MPSYETILEPINGLEAKKILKNMMSNCIDGIPLLKIGNAFKQIRLGFELIFEAFPADCPVPMAEWTAIMKLPDGKDDKFEQDVTKLEELKAKRAKLAENLDKIDAFLTKYSPTEIFTVVDSDNGIPDELRAKNGLKVPMISTSTSGKKNEVLVDPKGLKANVV